MNSTNLFLGKVSHGWRCVAAIIKKRLAPFLIIVRPDLFFIGGKLWESGSWRIRRSKIRF